MADAILTVDDLTTEFATADGSIRAIEEVSFELRAGETLGLVGESGSGKSVTAATVLRLLDENGRIASGSVQFEGQDLTTLDERALEGIRGDRIAMIFQDPMTALTPVLTVGTQITETIREHRGVTADEAKTRALELLADVQIAEPESILDAYPHELSGGMRQRVLVAIAISCAPDILIADEPTTALDVTIEAQILELLDRLAAERDMSVIHITHDLGVVAQTADRVAVMYSGRIVETGGVEDVFREPRHPYTAGLLRSTPRLSGVEPDIVPGNVPSPNARPTGCNFAPRCPHAQAACRQEDPVLVEEDRGNGSVACVRTSDLGVLDPAPAAETSRVPTDRDVGGSILATNGVRKEFASQSGFLDRLLPGGEPPVQAVDGVDVNLRENETLGLVGESGSGKTTLGRVLVGLQAETDGSITFDGRPMSEVPETELRQRVQFVFQDPNSSLNPRQTVGEILRYALRASDTPGRYSVEALLEEVGLDSETARSYPHELSGGQKQRVGIARALAVDPDVIVADEPTSALDVSVQGQILRLLEEIKADHGLSIVFISHDLSVVRHVSDRVAVMYLGRIVEVAETTALFDDARHPYTRALLSAVPEPDPQARRDRTVLDGELPDPRHPPAGCNFASRCPDAMPECSHRDPELADVDGRTAACFLHSDATRQPSEPRK